MRTSLVIFFILLLLLPVSAIGEIQTITHTVNQAFGGSQSPDDARIAAVAKAKREALEMAGVYIESLTVVKGRQVDKDEILALAAGVLKAEVVSQENYHTKDAFGINVVVKVAVDTSVLDGRVKKLLQDRTHMEQLYQARAREKELLEKIAVLEGENRKIGKSDQKQASLKKEFQDASRKLTAADWFYKALTLWVDGKFIDSQKAIEFMTNSIRLNPDDADAYNIRGAVYNDLGQYQYAIEDFNQAIHLKPGYHSAYGRRGTAYARLGQYQRAIEDYNESIRLQPDYADAYNNRGIAYVDLDQYQRAIEDYNEAIRLKPDFTKAYNNRGNAYHKLGQHHQAIQDYNQAIRLNPGSSEAYYNRGVVYLFQGNNNSGCLDAQKACILGNCKLLEMAKSIGKCR